MKYATLLLALALLGATPLSGQLVHFRLGAGWNVSDGEPIGGVYLDIPRNGIVLRTGALWGGNWGIQLPVMVLIGSDPRSDGPWVFAAVGGSLGIRASCCPGNTPHGLSGVVGAGFTVPLNPNLSIGAEIIYLRGLARIDGQIIRNTRRALLVTAGVRIPRR